MAMFLFALNLSTAERDDLSNSHSYWLLKMLEDLGAQSHSLLSTEMKCPK